MSDTPASPASSPTPRRWLGPALLASLVVNLFLVGLVASSIFMHRDGGGGPRGGPLGFLFGDFHSSKSGMSKDDRAALRKMMVGQFKTVRPYLVEMDDARTALAKSLGETPFNADAVSAAFDRIETARTESGKIMRDALVSGFAKMDDVQRARFSKIMLENAEKRWSKHRPGNKDGDRDGPPDGPPDGPDGPPNP
tara:strand:- start:164593 stop:165177 length:585 start_codon:yes stop_codon:yes gene_type:complete